VTAEEEESHMAHSNNKLKRRELIKKPYSASNKLCCSQKMRSLHLSSAGAAKIETTKKMKTERKYMQKTIENRKREETNI